LQYPSNLRVIRLPCSGKVDLTYLFRAFEVGADGVIVLGCLEGGCHFIEGNIHAKKRVNLGKEILDAIGVGGDRMEFYNLSAAMAPRFIEIIREMNDKIIKLGPFPKKVSLTEKTAEMTKREFLYLMAKNLALKKPEKPIAVPEGLEEWGRIEYNVAKCIGCKKCEENCPEKAITFVNEFDLATILKNLPEKNDGKVTKRRLMYETLANLAVKKPSKVLSAPEGMGEFWKMQYLPERCVICEKCNKDCPEKAISVIKEVDLPKIFGDKR